MTSILEGEKGTKRDVILLNSSVALLAGDKVRTLSEGMKLSEESLDSGSALRKLQNLVELSNKLE